MITVLLLTYVIPIYFCLAVLSLMTAYGKINPLHRLIDLTNAAVCFYFFFFLFDISNPWVTAACLAWTLVCTGRTLYLSTIGVHRLINMNPSMPPDMVVRLSRFVCLTCIPAITYVLCEYTSSLLAV